MRQRGIHENAREVVDGLRVRDDRQVDGVLFHHLEQPLLPLAAIVEVEHKADFIREL